MKAQTLTFWTACLVLVCPDAPGADAPAADPCVPEFSALAEFTIGGNQGTSALADFDEDGDLDLIIGRTFFLGDGHGKFGPSHRLPSPFPEAFDVKVADFDRDGHLDLATVRFLSDGADFYYGNGPADSPAELFEGPFFVAFSEPAMRVGVWHIEVGDFDNDGFPDLVGISFSGSGGLTILMNGHERNFTVSSHSMAVSFNHAVAVGDFDADGRLDVAVGRGSDFSIVFGNGDGTFGKELPGRLLHDLEPVITHRFRAADIDGDGRSDFFATGDSWILIFLGKDIDKTSGPPDLPSLTLDLSGGGRSARFLEIVDMNSDGQLDVVTLAQTASGSAYEIFLGERSGDQLSFVSGGSHVTEQTGRGSVLAVGDVSGDLSTDIVLTTEDTGRGQVFLNQSNCRPPLSVVAGDPNVDGKVDVSDVTAILAYLFLGESLLCPAAARVNGDEFLDIADPVYLLWFLFLGGSGPIDPGTDSCQGQ